MMLRSPENFISTYAIEAGIDPSANVPIYTAARYAHDYLLDWMPWY